MENRKEVIDKERLKALFKKYERNVVLADLKPRPFISAIEYEKLKKELGL